MRCLLFIYCAKIESRCAVRTIHNTQYTMQKILEAKYAPLADLCNEWLAQHNIGRLNDAEGCRFAMARGSEYRSVVYFTVSETPESCSIITDITGFIGEKMTTGMYLLTNNFAIYNYNGVCEVCRCLIAGNLRFGCTRCVATRHNLRNVIIPCAVVWTAVDFLPLDMIRYTLRILCDVVCEC